MKSNAKPKTRLLIWLVVIFGIIAVAEAYFIFTTRQAKPTAMKLFLPKDKNSSEQQTKEKPTGALTIILGENDGVFYYEGELAKDGSNIKNSNYTEIRKIIVDKKHATDEKDLVVVIKPANEASYKNAVDILDEMTINDVKRYAMVEISPIEDSIIRNK